MKTEYYYFDKDGNVVEDESQTEKTIIRELDENGVLIIITVPIDSCRKELLA